MEGWSPLALWVGGTNSDIDSEGHDELAAMAAERSAGRPAGPLKLVVVEGIKLEVRAGLFYG